MNLRLDSAYLIKTTGIQIYPEESTAQESFRNVTFLSWHMQAFKFEDRILINPGSATGAYSDVIEAPKPSFVLMDIDGSKVWKLTYWCIAHPIVHG